VRESQLSRAREHHDIGIFNPVERAGTGALRVQVGSKSLGHANRQEGRTLFSTNS